MGDHKRKRSRSRSRRDARRSRSKSRDHDSSRRRRSKSKNRDSYDRSRKSRSKGRESASNRKSKERESAPMRNSCDRDSRKRMERETAPERREHDNEGETLSNGESAPKRNKTQSDTHIGDNEIAPSISAEIDQMRKSMDEQKQMITSFISSYSEDYVDIAVNKTADYRDILESDSESVTAQNKESESESKDCDDEYENNILFSNLDTQKKGPPIPDRYIRFVNHHFGNECDSETIKTIKEKYLEPENTFLLSGKDLNEEIQKTSAVNKTMKSRDFSLKIVQHNIGASATACIQSLDKIKSDEKIPKETKQHLAQTICDALVLQAKCMQDLSVTRMQLLKPALNRKFADQLVTLRHHDDKELFGKELSKSIKEIEDTSKATQDIGRYVAPYQSGKYTPTMRGRGYNRYHSRGFLARTNGRGRAYRGYQSHYQYPQHTQQNTNKTATKGPMRGKH